MATLDSAIGRSGAAAYSLQPKSPPVCRDPRGSLRMDRQSGAIPHVQRQGLEGTGRIIAVSNVCASPAISSTAARHLLALRDA